MKTDRELLELAAKAAGLEVVMTQPFIGMQIRNGNLWNPLTDDGDAMRLAAALRLEVFWLYASEQVVVDFAVDEIESICEGYDEYSDDGLPQPDNRAPALRRAIVRAAAAIGEAMQ